MLLLSAILSACVMEGVSLLFVMVAMYVELMVKVGWDAIVVSPRLWIDIYVVMAGQRVVESTNSEDAGVGVFGRSADAPMDDIEDVEGGNTRDIW